MRRLWRIVLAFSFGCGGNVEVRPADGGPPDVIDARSDRNEVDVQEGGTTVSPWPGWHILPNPAGCMVAVPDDPKQMPLWTWMPCETKTPGCEQLDLPKYRDVDQASALWRTWSSYNGRFIDVLRYLDPTYVEHDVFDTKLGAPIAAYRLDSFATCWVHPILGDTLGTFLLQTRNATGISGTWLASGSFAQLMTAPNFIQLDKTFFSRGFPGIFGWGASDSLIALDAYRSSIGRIAPGSGLVDATAYLHLEDPFVHGQDVLALDDLLQWRRELRVDPKGSVVLLRQVANTHALGFHGDGTDLFWTECAGGSSGAFWGHPQVSVWRAPYTVDPNTLAATAKRIAVLDGITTRCAGPTETALSAGRYAFDDDHAGVFFVSNTGNVRRWNTEKEVDVGIPLSIDGDWITAGARIYPGGKLDWATVLVRVKVP